MENFKQNAKNINIISENRATVGTRESSRASKTRETERGVTILALVITVIVLLILAGVSITFISGDNGIITNAQSAAKQTEIADSIEQLQLKYYEQESSSNYNDIGLEEYLDYLEENGIATTEKGGKYYASINNKMYEISMDAGGLKIEYVEDGTIANPRIQRIDVTGKTNDSITIKATALRMENGTYHYYIGTDESNLGSENGNNTTGEFTFTNLTQGQTYYIKVVGENLDGEESSKTITEKLEAVPDATSQNMTVSINWSGANATVDIISSERNFIVQTSLDNVTYENKSLRTGLSNGDVIYARFSSGLYAGKEMVINVVDSQKPTLSVSVKETTSKTIEVEATATDKESGLTSSKPFKFYIAETEDAISSVTPTTNTTGTCKFDNLNQNTTYYIKVTIEDVAGNTATSMITETTDLIPKAETGILKGITWNSDGTAKIRLLTETKYTIQHSIDRSNWNDYTDVLSTKNGDTVYICLTDGKNQGEDYAIKIEDNQGPMVEVAKSETSSSTIKVNVSAIDAVSGMSESPKYNYYIKQEQEEEYTLKETNSTSTTYTYSELTAKTTYNIKVTTSDLIGNKGEGTLDATTEEFTIATGNITFSDSSWSNKEAAVVITNNTKNNMQYQVLLPDKEVDNTKWTTVTAKTETVESLKDNYTIVARLYDGTNTTGYATCKIEDNNLPTISNVTGLSQEWTNQDVTLTITASDSESGLQEKSYSFDGGKNWQSENTKTYTENTSGIVIKVRDEAENIATYNTINITNIDKTGPVIDVKTDATANSIKIEVTSITDGGVGVTSPTYKYFITSNSKEIDTISGEESKNTTKEYTELIQDTTYYIKIEVQDDLENVSKVYRTIATGSLDASSTDLNITDPVWTNKLAEVKITNSSDYDIEYQIVADGETLDQNGTWTKSTNKENTIGELKHNYTVYARLTDGKNVSGTIIKEVKDNTLPVITEVTGNSEQWTNQNITLTVTASDLESGLAEQCYSFDGGETWQAENTKTYEKNIEGIVIKVKNEAGGISTYDVIDITKIDKDGPSIIIEEKETTTKQITIEIRPTDKGVGMGENPTYTYSLKAEGEEEYTKIETTQETTHTFNDLKSDTKYTIKVETKDTLENKGEETAEISTKSLLYAAGNIESAKVVWSNSIATITIENKTEKYDMEYQIAKNGADIKVDGTWKSVTEKTIDVGNLEDKDIVYARLTDGVNVTTGYATFNIRNSSEKTYTEEQLAKNTTRKDYDILTISTNSDEIRVQIEGAQDNAQLYNYYYKTINDENYTLISTNTNYNDPAVIKGVKEGVAYKIKVLVTGQDGNVTRCENTSTVIALEQAEKNTTYTDNRTYIDESKEIDVSVLAGTGSYGTGETEKVKAGYTISLPESFKISNTTGETTQETGVVLKDSLGNEYVWIPVNDAIYDGTTEMPTSSGTATRTHKPMAITQSGNSYYEGIIYTFNGTNSYRNTGATVGKSSYREPSLITSNSNDKYTWDGSSIAGVGYDASEDYYKNILGFENTKEYGEYIVSSYTNMVTSVDIYGGFYVGRYETTKEEDGEDIIVGSKPNSMVLSNTNWYKMNLYQDSQRYDKNPYSTTASVTSSMIWGSQWDQMLNYILKTGTNLDYVSNKKLGTQKNKSSNSAEDSSDIIYNIYDLGSNTYEWTQEANSTNARVYRGGSYDSSTSAKLSTRANGVPSDQGPSLGTRLSLYVQSTNDVTGPAIKEVNTIATSSTIKVDVKAIDNETGVYKYRYYISQDGNEWSEVVESNANSYTFTGLSQNTKYYIKVEAKDRAGNIGDSEQVTEETGGLGDVATSNISISQKYGANGEGVIQLTASSEYIDSGYYIEYQVLEASETIDISTNWTKGDTITGLSNGQILYATLYDGTNRPTDYFREEVSGLEEYAYIDRNGNTYTEEEAQNVPGTTSYDATVQYSDGTDTAYIPAGFKVGITDTVNTINDGLVIQDADGNQYVWIPVENAVETDSSTTSTEKAMARYQSGYSESSTKKYYEGVLYNFSGTTSTKRSSTPVLGTLTYREPSLVTAGADYTWNIAKGAAVGTSYDTLETYYKYMNFGTNSGVNAFSSYTEFGIYMNEEYSNMIQSVNKYKGFYVGRYETSTKNDVLSQDAIVQSQIGKTPIYNKTWYYDYYYQDSNINSKNPYYNSKSVTSSMIWGNQWDAMMNWMLEDDKTRNFVTKVTGNHTDAVSSTGSYTSDLAKNIFDLSSNVAEWTQEAGTNASYRIYRGGYCVTENDKYGVYSASGRYTIWQPPNQTVVYTNPTNTGSDSSKNYLGSRIALYIKNDEDETVPEISVEKTNVGTNSIEVKVNAIDGESGISKYKYSISYYNFEDQSFVEDDILSEVETYGSAYTFTGLTQNQTYYIKIEATNGAGKSASCYTGALKTDFLEIQQEEIALSKIYGKDGSGTAYFVLTNDALIEEGYYMQHLIIKQGETYSEDSWTSSSVVKGDTVTGLSVGDKIYTRIYDGQNQKEGFYKTSDVTELETFSDTYTSTELYEDKTTIPNEDGTTTEVIEGTAYIPAGFKVATSDITKKIKSGLVIEDEVGNQYVWIPVEEVIYDETTKLAQSGNTETYKPMFRYQTSSDQYFEGILYNYSGTRSYVQRTSNALGTSSCREPSLVTNSTTNYSWVFNAGNDYDATNYTKLSDLGITSSTQMGEYLNSKYTEIVESISEYGGFYIGRYETSLFTEDGKNETYPTADTTIVKSVSGATPMASIDWYRMYLSQSSDYEKNPYNMSTSVTSTMITGSMWDRTLNYILEGTDSEKVTAVTGNHTGTRAKTGQYGSDIMNNIFDLSSNVREWTTEANSSAYRVYRGGIYSATDVSPASDRIYNLPTITSNGVGSRLSLYLK